MKNLKMLTKEWDVVLGVMLGTWSAPKLTALVSGMIQGYTGNLTAAVSSFGVAAAALILLGGQFPGLAVSFAAVYVTQGAFAAFPTLKP